MRPINPEDMFNSIEMIYPCPYCGAEREVEVQFKYSNLNFNQYRIGDHISWARTSYGKPGKEVYVSGIAVCRTCDSDWDVDILIKDNQICEVLEPTIEYPRSEGFFIVR